MAVHWGGVTNNTSHFGAYINIYEIANSVNITENTSRVGVEFHITRSNWGWIAGSAQSGNIVIDGTSYSFSYQPNWAYASSGDVTIAYFEKTVKHNDDGAKWCEASASWWTSGTYSCGTASASGGVTLTTIPRATACPNLDGYIEGSANIILNPASTSFKHRLYYSYNGKTGYFPSSTEFFADKGSLDLDKTFYDYTPKSSGTGNVTLYTYNSNGTQIGSKTGTITIRCDAEKCKPEISSTLIDINDETVALTGHNEKLVKGYSNVQVTYTITTLNGATLASKTLNGSALGDSPYVINSVSTDTFTIVATDSRGFSTTDGKTNTMVEYIPLALNFNAFRPTPTGSEIKINFTGNYFNGTFGSVANTLALSWKYRILRTSEWTDGGTFVAGTDYTISGNQFYSGTGSSASDISLSTTLFPYNQAYEIAIFFADKLVDTYSTKPVPKGEPVLNWEDGLVNVNGDLKINNHNILDMLYPIGRGFIDFTDTDYSNYLGLSWERELIGMTPVGLNKNDEDFNEIGKTGGEKEHTLTVNEMPSHRHTEKFGDVAWVDGNGNGSSVMGNTVQYVSTTTTKANLTDFTGGNQPHNNMQPYQVVAYWKRVA